VLNKIHRLSAMVIGALALVHLANHLVALRGIDRHITLMENVRGIVRIPVVEALLLACVAIQIGSGLYFVARRWGERTQLFDRLQALSGGYLAFFLLVHVSSVMFGRVKLDLDTNFYFAAAGLNIAPWPLFFVPYYGLAVLALVVHVACAFHYLARERFTQRMRDSAGYAAIGASAVLAAVIVAAFSGAFYAVEIPPEYERTFR